MRELKAKLGNLHKSGEITLDELVVKCKEVDSLTILRVCESDKFIDTPVGFIPLARNEWTTIKYGTITYREDILKVSDCEAIKKLGKFVGIDIDVDKTHEEEGWMIIVYRAYGHCENTYNIPFKITDKRI